MQIIDGTGNGYRAGVLENHHILSKTIAETIIGYKSRVQQNAFSISTPIEWSVGTSAVSVLVVNNAETVNKFIVNKIFVSHNGGDTSGDKTVLGTVYKNTSIPTTNIYGSQGIPFGNLNLGSSQVTSCVGYLWDNASTGLDGDKGDLAFQQRLGKGLNIIDLSSSFILNPSQKIRFDIKADETTKCLITVSGFLCSSAV